MKDFISKLQNLSEGQKKIIFFTVMIIVAIIIFFLGIILTKKNILRLSESLGSLSFPAIETPDQNVNYI